MTVSELIEQLQKYDGDLPVIATWEGVSAGFEAECFEVTETDGRTELLIDVNY